jgi:thiol-disulfide isomerase/thioredoxin
VAPSTSPPAAPQKSMGIFWTILALSAAILVLYVFKSGFLKGGSAVNSPSNRLAAPDLKVSDATDASRHVSIGSMKGKVAVLHFWATWCPPCRAEFPEFAKFASGSGPEDPWVVLAVSVDDSATPVGPFVENLPKKFPVYWDSGGLASAMGLSAVPSTVILDKAGRVAWQSTGVADWTPKGVPAIVRELGNE